MASSDAIHEKSGEALEAKRAPAHESDPKVSAPPTRREIEDGLAYLHTRIGATAGRVLEAASFTYALIEILFERGLVSLEDIDSRKKEVAPRLLKRFEAQDSGVSVQQSQYDKYQVPQEVAIDCENRVSLCKAACCKMVFPLFKQDIEERVINWQLGQPYLIAKGEDGYCGWAAMIQDLDETLKELLVQKVPIDTSTISSTRACDALFTVRDPFRAVFMTAVMTGACG